MITSEYIWMCETEKGFKEIISFKLETLKIFLYHTGNTPVIYSANNRKLIIIVVTWSTRSGVWNTMFSVNKGETSHTVFRPLDRSTRYSALQKRLYPLENVFFWCDVRVFPSLIIIHFALKSIFLWVMLVQVIIVCKKQSFCTTNPSLCNNL